MQQLSDIVRFLEHAYEITNAKYFNNELPKVIISVSQARGCYGYFTTSKVWKDNDNTYFEICITSDIGLNRSIYSVIATLIHEQVHCFCATQTPPIKDVSRGGHYHNRIFREQAEKRGLVIGYSNKIGWSITSPSTDLIAFIDSLGWKDIDLSRTAAIPISGLIGGQGNGTNGTDNGTVQPKKKGHTRKYICPECGISVRATKEVRISCLDCNLPMVIEEK